MKWIRIPLPPEKKPMKTDRKKEKKKERKEKEAAEVSFMNVFSCLPRLWRQMLTRATLWLGRRVEKGEEGEEREEGKEGKEGEEEQGVILCVHSALLFHLLLCCCSRGLPVLYFLYCAFLYYFLFIQRSPREMTRSLLFMEK